MRHVKLLLDNQLLVGFLTVIVFWQMLYYILQTHTIASPILTILYMWDIKGILLLHVLASMLRIIVSIAVALMIGIPIGIFIGKHKKLNQLFSPFLYILYPVPKVAFLPIFMLLYGLGNTSKIILIIWIVIFQIILSVRDGVQEIPKTYFQVMRGFSASERHTVKHLLLPAILPSLFSALRISIGISLASLFFAENYATIYGIGYFILSAWTKMNYVEMFAGIAALGLLGLFIFVLLDKLELLITPWRKK